MDPQSAHPTSLTRHPVVLFDGVCNLCNGAVDFILRHDRSGDLLLASLQSDEAGPLLAQADLPPDYLDSLVLVEGNRWYTRSDAALEIARRMGGAWKLAVAFKILPRFLRDGIYDWIARNRYRWFGKRDSCRVPTEAERRRFL